MEELAAKAQKEKERYEQQAGMRLEATKKQMTEIIRKVEQRCFRLESEKQQLKQRHEEEMQNLLKKHKDELNQIQEERFKGVDELRKDYEGKARSFSFYLYFIQFIFIVQSRGGAQYEAHRSSDR